MTSRCDMKYRYTVYGHGAFPVDMLRYDKAKILDEQNDPEYVYTYTMESPRHPTVARWNSFLWNVENIRRGGVNNSRGRKKSLTK